MAQRVHRIANLNPIIARSDKVVTIFKSLSDEFLKLRRFVVFLSFENSMSEPQKKPIGALSAFDFWFTRDCNWCLSEVLQRFCGGLGHC